VVLVRIHRQQGKPGVIGFVDGAPERMLVDIPDREGLKVIS
jgi:hypothetical protein